MIDESSKPVYSGMMCFGVMFTDDFESICRLYEKKGITPTFHLEEDGFLQRIANSGHLNYPPMGWTNIEPVLGHFCRLAGRLDSCRLVWDLKEYSAFSFKEGATLSIFFTGFWTMIEVHCVSDDDVLEATELAKLTKEKLLRIRRPFLYRHWRFLTLLVLPIGVMSHFVSPVSQTWLYAGLCIPILWIGGALTAHDYTFVLYKSTQCPWHIRRARRARVIIGLLAIIWGSFVARFFEN